MRIIRRIRKKGRGRRPFRVICVCSGVKLLPDFCRVLRLSFLWQFWRLVFWRPFGLGHWTLNVLPFCGLVP